MWLYLHFICKTWRLLSQFHLYGGEYDFVFITLRGIHILKRYFFIKYNTLYPNYILNGYTLIACLITTFFFFLLLKEMIMYISLNIETSWQHTNKWAPLWLSLSTYEWENILIWFSRTFNIYFKILIFHANS